jgi:hypothetical protein
MNQPINLYYPGQRVKFVSGINAGRLATVIEDQGDRILLRSEDPAIPPHRFSTHLIAPLNSDSTRPEPAIGIKSDLGTPPLNSDSTRPEPAIGIKSDLGTPPLNSDSTRPEPAIGIKSDLGTPPLNSDSTRPEPAIGNWRIVTPYDSKGRVYHRLTWGCGHRIEGHRHIPGGSGPTAQRRAQLIGSLAAQGRPLSELMEAIARFPSAKRGRKPKPSPGFGNPSS